MSDARCPTAGRTPRYPETNRRIRAPDGNEANKQSPDAPAACPKNALRLYTKDDIANFDSQDPRPVGVNERFTLWDQGPVKARSCCRLGTFSRACCARDGSISADITQGSVPASARTSPQGETIRLWP